LGSNLDVLLRSFPISSITSPFKKVFRASLSNLIWLYWGFLKGFWIRFFWMPLGSPSLIGNLFPHFQWWVRLIFVENIALMAYLGNWVLVTLVITFRFLLDFNPFYWNKWLKFIIFLDSFEFDMWVFSPNGNGACPPFEEMAKRGVDQLHDSISKRLHEHSFSSIIFDLHQGCLKSLDVCITKLTIFFLNVLTWHGKIFKSPLSILHSFYKQRMLMALQHAQGTSISKHALTIGEGSSRLNHLPSHYLICSLQLRVWILDLFMFPLCSTLVGGFFFLPWLGSIHLVPFPPSFLGVLLLWHFTGFHHYYCQLEYVENVPHVRFLKQCHLKAQVISSFSTYQIPSGTP